MLLNDFFLLKTKSATESNGKTAVTAQITLNKSHPIFGGHFPNQPVVPGVCMVQIIKEILENHLRCRLLLVAASNIKFISLIDPAKNSELNAEIIYTPKENDYDVDAQLFFESVIFFKIKGTFSAALS